MTSAEIDQYFVKHHGVPHHIREGMVEYMLNGRPMGGFLTAIFSNDLYLVMKKADTINREHLHDILDWIQAVPPALCHGSSEAVGTWLALHRQRRTEEYGILHQSNGQE